MQENPLHGHPYPRVVARVTRNKINKTRMPQAVTVLINGTPKLACSSAPLANPNEAQAAIKETGCIKSKITQSCSRAAELNETWGYLSVNFGN